MRPLRVWTDANLVLPTEHINILYRVLDIGCCILNSDKCKKKGGGSMLPDVGVSNNATTL